MWLPYLKQGPHLQQPQTISAEASAGSWFLRSCRPVRGAQWRRSALYMKLWDIIRSELCFCCISGGKTPGRPRVVINFMCLVYSHHSERRWGLGMIDGGQEGDGPWNCSTPSVPLIAGRSSEITSLHLPRINKATVDFAELHSGRSLEPHCLSRWSWQRVPCASYMCLQK